MSVKTQERNYFIFKMTPAGCCCSETLRADTPNNQKKKKKNVAAIKVHVEIFLKVEHSGRNLPERLFSLKIETVVVTHRSLVLSRFIKKQIMFSKTVTFLLCH